MDRPFNRVQHCRLDHLCNAVRLPIGYSEQNPDIFLGTIGIGYAYPLKYDMKCLRQKVLVILPQKGFRQGIPGSENGFEGRDQRGPLLPSLRIPRAVLSTTRHNPLQVSFRRSHE